MARRRWSFFMTPLEHGGLRALDDLYRCLLTPPGRVLFWAGLSAAVMLLGGLAAPLVVAFAFCASALACAILAGALFRPRLQLVRRMPPPASAGDELVYRVEVRNAGRFA